MPRYALIELSTMTVLNVAAVTTVPAAPLGFRNVIENTTNPALNEWTPGDDPAVGEIWDGQIPASFAPPAPPPVEDVEKSAQDIIEEIRAKANEMLGRADALEAKLG